tara:strand:+ start:11759 stop:13072 length:1314 start_codon:yes stop_codon:yes gene_type:complete
MRNKLAYFFIVIISGCTLGKKSSISNNAFMYTDSIKTTQTNYKIFNNSHNTSVLYYRINTNNLLKVYSIENKLNTIDYTIRGKLYDNYIENLIDSFIISKVITADSIIYVSEEIELKCKENERYVLSISLTDNHKKSTNSQKINIDRRSINQNDYLILNKKGEIQFKNYISINDSICIKNRLENKELFVRYFQPKSQIAKPPYITGKIVPKEIVTSKMFSLLTETDSFNLTINEQGIYQITNEIQLENGITLLAFNTSYPNINSVEDMILPIEYITTDEEFLKLKEEKNNKLAIDKFWLERANNNKKNAKDLIYKFYKRVQESNIHFSSYKAGWKTDRGMIMIVFGPPNIVYQSENGESWIYGEKNNIYSLNFTFSKINNKFTDNDYELNRSIYFRTIWNNAQIAWKDGYAYSDIDIKKRIYEQEKRKRQSQLYFWY